MKSMIYALVFVLAGVAHADQQQPQPQPQPPVQQQPVVVEFSTLFKVFTCTKVQDSQDYSCDAGAMAPEKQVVTLEKSAHQGMMVGSLSLGSSEVQGYKHEADISVRRHTTQQGTHYGFHLSESFAKADTQVDDFSRTYGAIHVDEIAKLNEVTFYGRITVDGDKLYIPVLIVAPAHAEARTLKVSPTMF